MLGHHLFGSEPILQARLLATVRAMRGPSTRVAWDHGERIRRLRAIGHLE